jgi:rubrerythrin
MPDETQRSADHALEFIEFFAIGADARGTYACAECGYGITLYTALPRCPMCGGGSWEPARARRSRVDG